MGTTFLPGKTVDLRATRESDLETLRQAGNDPQVWKTLREFYPSTPQDEREYVRGAQENESRVMFTIASNDRPVGRIDLRGLSDRTGDATTSYFIVPDQSGRGYATEAVGLILKYGFDQLRLHRITSYAMEFDEGSRRVLEKNGFSREGTKRDAAFVNGMYCDVELWGLLEDEYRGGTEDENDD